MAKALAALGAVVTVAMAGSITRFPPSVADRMDTTVDPCEDFYEYACGAWYKNTAIPASDGGVSTMSIMAKEANDVVKTFLNTNYNDFYKSCMDTDKLESLGVTPLESPLRSIRNTQSKSELLSEAAGLTKFGIPMFATFVTAADDRNASVNSLFGRQVVLPLTSPSYYINDTYWKAVEANYTNYISTLFQLVGRSYDQAIIAAAKVIQFEKSTAGFEFSKLETMDAEASSSVYFPFTLHGASERFPMTIGSMLRAYRFNMTATAPISPGNRIVFYNLHYFDKMEALLNATSLETLRTIVEYKLLHASAPSLSSDFEYAHWSFFQRQLSGVTKQDTREYKCTKAASEVSSKLVGAYFLQQKWSADASKMANDMIDAVTKSIQVGFDHAEWLDNSTRANATFKLSKVVRQIGGPRDWAVYSDVDFAPSAFLNNQWKFQQSVTKARMDAVGKRLNKEDWTSQITPQTLNAFYSPSMNRIIIPAAILQPPLFHPAADPAQNFGAVGMVIGHELTHGFDNHGRQYDANGDIKSWWRNNTAYEFAKKAQCIVDQYGNFNIASETTGVVLDSVNGELTLGETIAGVKASFRAYKEYVKTHASEYTNETGEKLFFLSFAQTWCGKFSDSVLRNQILDVHPPVASVSLALSKTMPTLRERSNALRIHS
ncbi:hypothetical protein LEN26_005466 [Aphanomyces euteiches]|nr:hypothetical protein AeMF1_000403 [Aphanomyces euteiches]KAH9138068.1 hypothetical protein LEN26_005466 [Aphanomyces euteiches]